MTPPAASAPAPVPFDNVDPNVREAIEQAARALRCEIVAGAGRAFSVLVPSHKTAFLLGLETAVRHNVQILERGRR